MNDHQKTLLAMLKDLDLVCKDNDIKYMLFAGTALGAVRHNGFIPWDDDLDVVMQRDQYNRFLDAAEVSLDRSKYFVQREFSEHWPMQFSKIRLNNTACIEKFRAKDQEMHQGVYIDVFPCDNLADQPMMRLIQFAASKIIIAKALYARGYATNNVLKLTFMQICRLLPLDPFIRICERAEDRNSAKVHTFLGGSSKYRKSVFDRIVFEDSVDMKFEDGYFPVSAHADEMLTTMYGNYHRIPDISERSIKNHLEILDLDNDYTQYLEKQKTMTIHGVSKSIR